MIFSFRIVPIVYFLLLFAAFQCGPIVRGGWMRIYDRADDL